MGAGNAQAANTVMQMVDPWKYGVQNTKLLVPAQRSAAAGDTGQATSVPSAQATTTN